MSDGAGTDRREAIRLGGTIREIVEPPIRRTARVGSKVHHDHADGELLVDVDGNAVRITVPGNAIIDAGEVITGAWSELVKQSGGRLPASLAPAFESAELEVAQLVVGGRVEIYGEVMARAIAGDIGYRETPSHHVSAVRALVVAGSKVAAAEMDRAIAERFPPARRSVPRSGMQRLLDGARERGKRDPSSPHYRHDPPVIVVELAAIAIAVCAVLYAVTDDSPWAIAVAFAAAVTFVLARATPPVRAFRAHERGYGFAIHVDPMVAMMGCIGPYVLVVTGVPFFLTPFGVATIAICELACGMLFGLAATSTLLAHSKLLRAPIWDGSVGKYAAIEGIVRDPTPTPIGVIDSALGRGTGYKKHFSDSGAEIVWQRFHADGTFLVETPRGVVEVSPDHVVWSTSVSGRHEKANDASFVEFESIPVGGRVLAAGWITSGATAIETSRAPRPPARMRPASAALRSIPQLQADGTKPAFLVATSADGDPRGWLLRIRRSHLLTLVMAIAIAVTYAVHYRLV